MIETLIASLCLLAGALLIFSGGVGVLRFPDFFSRMHAAGITETLAASLIILGLMILADWGITQAKLIFIFLFLMVTSPTASHALAKSALHGGLDPNNSRNTNKSADHNDR